MDNTQIQPQYPAPKCEVFEVELEDFMKPASSKAGFFAPRWSLIEPLT